MADKKGESKKSGAENEEKADKEKNVDKKEDEDEDEGSPKKEEEKEKEGAKDEKKSDKEKDERAERKKKERAEKERDKEQKKNKVPRQKRRPKDTAFWQQRIPAWNPVLNAGTMLPLFFVLGLAFIPLGAGLLYFSSEVREKVVEYTSCQSGGGENNERCSDMIENNPSGECHCSINFTLEHDFQGKVYMYYYLTNFYQNHRKYVRSRDNHQLHGQVDKKPREECKPFRYSDGGNGSKAIVPCGAIANSLFSDKLALVSQARGENVPLIKTGIAWPSDKNVRFKNPGGNLSDAFSKYSKPPNWKGPASELDPEDKDNNGFVNEDFIVWMRCAALPDFRKLYRRVDHSAEGYINGLAEGNYTLEVNYSYPVISFKGTKSMILSTTSLIGGRNPFLGIAYIVVGAICICLAIVFLILHLKYGKTAKEMIHVNPSNPYQ